MVGGLVNAVATVVVAPLLGSNVGLVTASPLVEASPISMARPHRASESRPHMDLVDDASVLFPRENHQKMLFYLIGNVIFEAGNKRYLF